MGCDSAVCLRSQLRESHDLLFSQVQADFLFGFSFHNIYTLQPIATRVKLFVIRVQGRFLWNFLLVPSGEEKRIGRKIRLQEVGVPPPRPAENKALGDRHKSET